MGTSPLPGVSSNTNSPYGKRDHANRVLQGELAAVGPTKAAQFRGPMNLFIWGEYATTLDTVNGNATATTGGIGLIEVGNTVDVATLPPGSTVASIAGDDVDIALPILGYSGIPVPGHAQINEIQDTQWLLGAEATGLGLDGIAVTDILVESVYQQPGLPNVMGQIELLSAPTVNAPDNGKVPYDFVLSTDAIVTGTGVAAIFRGESIGLTGTVQLERSFDGGSTWVVCNVGSAGAIASWSMASPVSISFGEPEDGILYRLNVLTITPSPDLSIHYRISETGQAATTLAVPALT